MEDNKNVKMKIANFIQNKDLEKQLLYSVKNLQRKHEIISKEYQMAIKSTGQK
jgi:hypothetical protein